jgi:lipoate-protein ligase A
MIIIDIPRPGLENMRLDSENLLAAEANLEPFTAIRLYGWSQPTVSVGKHQKIERAVDVVYCRRRGIDVVRRPTGGRAVFHANEVTYAVISNDSALFPIQSISRTYALLSEMLRDGLQKLGVETEFSTGTPSRQGSPTSARQTPCFVTPARHELLFQGRKLIGSAQRRLRRSFLQHGSVPIEIDCKEMGRILGFSEKCLRQSTVSLSEAAGRTISFDEAARALKEGFQTGLMSKCGKAV